MTCLGSNSGCKIDLINPDPEQFKDEDIATGLSNLCRFNGQIKKWYSVAEHCIKVAEMVPPRFKLQALLHDAPEAFVCDVPTPLKHLLGDTYRDIENRLAKVIGDKFGVDLVNLPDCVKQADKMLTVTEHHSLQMVPIDWVWDHSILRYPNFTRLYSSPTEARAAYVKKLVELSTP